MLLQDASVSSLIPSPYTRLFIESDHACQIPVHNHMHKLYVSTTVLFDVSNEYHSLVTATLSAVLWALWSIVFSLPSLFLMFPNLTRLCTLWWSHHKVRFGDIFVGENTTLAWNSCTCAIYTPMAHHFTLPPRTALMYHVYSSVSHLLCAMLAMGSATCIAKNSMFVSPVSACAAHAIIAHAAGVGITRNFLVVWHTNITDFLQILVNLSTWVWKFFWRFEI